MASAASPKRGASFRSRSPCVSAAITPRKANRAALPAASSPKRACVNTGKLVCSPAMAKWSANVASISSRNSALRNAALICDTGSRSRQRTSCAVRRSGGSVSFRVRLATAKVSDDSAPAV